MSCWTVVSQCRRDGFHCLCAGSTPVCACAPPLCGCVPSVYLPVGVSPVCPPNMSAGEVSLVGQEVEVFRCYTRPWFSAVVTDHNLATGALTIMDANVLMPYTLERHKVQIRLSQGVKGERRERVKGREGEGE